MPRGRVLSGVLVALLVGACGSTTTTPSPTGSSPTGSSPTGSSPTGPAPTAASSAPVSATNPNAIIRVAEAVAPSTLDPQESTLGADWYAWQLAYQCLLTTDNTGAIQPQLASSYTVTSDNLTYEFTVRPNVSFHNGDVMTSADVVYSFDRLNSKGVPLLKGRFYPSVQSVVAVDTTKVRFTLKAPDPNFIRNMANPGVSGCAIIDKNVAESSLAQMMVGTGPYQMTTYVPNQELDVKVFDKYWGQKPSNGGLKILYVPDTLTQLADVRSGQVDLFFPAYSLLTTLSLDKSIKLGSTVSDQIEVLAINSSKKPFDNVLVRQAIALAIDRTAIDTVVFNGAAVPSSYLPPRMTWGPKLSDTPYGQLDIAKAKSLLVQAGYPKGLSAHLMYIAGFSAEQTAGAAVLQSQLGAIGIIITLDAFQQAVWSTNLNKPDYDLAYNFYTGFANPYEYLRVRATRTGPIPPSLQTLIDQLPSATTDDTFQPLVSKIALEEANLAYPNVPLVARKSYVAYVSTLGNVTVSPDQTRMFLANITAP